MFKFTALDKTKIDAYDISTNKFMRIDSIDGYSHLYNSKIEAKDFIKTAKQEMSQLRFKLTTYKANGKETENIK
ncbi:hypothetical protein OA502_02020 [Prochlorococcus sp. AH-716-I05]|nr:hypothetical protein [Prochlorococcus sp. AH-716-I05]